MNSPDRSDRQSDVSRCDVLISGWHVCLVVAVGIASLTLFGTAESEGVSRAYVGPGAGITLVGSLFVVLVAMATALLSFLTWPIRWIWRSLKNWRTSARAKVRRVVILGLDGLEPQLVDEYLQQGLLPNLANLRDQGCYARLGTTWPPLSPVAWSSFSTGTNPGKHNIFDFLTRSPLDYQPRMSSVQIQPPPRAVRLGKYQIPLSRSRVVGLRKSKPFWNVLGEAGVFSAVLRVPITFPPDKFHGVQLSAMCVPDLRGTQGTYSYFVEEGETGLSGEGDVGGQRIAVERQGNAVHAYLNGPDNSLCPDGPQIRLPLKIIATARGEAVLYINKHRVRLVPHQFTDWIRVEFRLAPGVKVRGVCRFWLKRFGPPFEMYCTPTQIDPDRPVMPISHPHVYSVYLAKQQGTYATLGLAEDTWSLSERAMSEEAFLDMAYRIDDERKAMFFDSLKRVGRGLVVCVFDAPDRIQHMFWRFLDDSHPAREIDDRANDAHRNTIREMYQRMDALVGRTMSEIGDKTALVVMSDHGFKPFRRGVDLNAWLRDAGYLKLKKGVSSSTRVYLADVDWSGTQAYALGLAGIFINQQGREAEGIVAAGKAKNALVEKLCAELSGLQDTERNDVAIQEAVAREKVYHGPYVAAAPDIIIGYNVGYRVSWESASGKCSRDVFSDNKKAWSGDHCIHPSLVPGVLFSNLKLGAEHARIVDIGPTTLDLLGVDKPSYMDGRSLLNGQPAQPIRAREEEGSTASHATT